MTQTNIMFKNLSIVKRLLLEPGVYGIKTSWEASDILLRPY